MYSIKFTIDKYINNNIHKQELLGNFKFLKLIMIHSAIISHL